MPFRFALHRTDAGSAARRGTFHTLHGPVETPAFMPVGTQAAIKGLTIDQVRSTGAQMILGNTYHLALRPGEQIIRDLGGLHRFMGWDGPILTDSGGFQLFIQEALGSDVAMVLDHVVALPAADDALRDACDRTIRWAARCKAAATRADQAQFAIVQGGLNPELRVWCARQLADLDFPGYAVGGLSVGESPDEMYQVLDVVCPAMPADKPRYLMGVGTPRDLLHAVRRGIDLFDCVLPTRNGRNALAFTDEGPLRLRNQIHQRDERPLEPSCPCLACRHSRAYLRHLFLADEMLGPILLTHHNLTYYQRLLAGARQAIEQARFADYFDEKMRGWHKGDELKASGAKAH
jgi:queuine tRNA-ribosyltransferase